VVKKYTTRRFDWRRTLVPLALIVVWFAIAGVGGPYFGRIDEVSSNDLSTFLPKSAESTAVSNELTRFQDNRSIPTTIIFEKSDTLSQADRQGLTDLISKLQQVKGVNGTISPPIIAKDGKAALVVVPIARDAELKTVFGDIKSTINQAKTGLRSYVGGPASYSRDLQVAFSGIDGTLLLVALAVVFIILLIVYRSPLLPIIVLMTSMVALSAAIYIVWHTADAGIITLNGQVQGILFILVIGATTDYSLLYLSRLREELFNRKKVIEATVASLRGTVEPILATGATVIAGLMCLLLSDLGSNKALGPVGGIGIAVAMLAALTFLPAALSLFGRRAFWPRTPQYDPAHMNSYNARHRAWARIGTYVSSHPRKLWVVTSCCLLLACLGFFQLRASGVAQSDLVLGYSEAREAQQQIDDHFAGGSGVPAYVITPSGKLNDVVDLLDKDASIASVSAIATGSPSGTVPIGNAKAEFMRTLGDGIRAKLASDPLYLSLDEQGRGNLYRGLLLQADPFAAATPKIVDGDIVLQATLTDEPDSDAAKATIVRLRNATKSVDSTIRIGGVTALQLDTNTTSARDSSIIIPAILAAITVILIVLLRSLVAPFVLLLTTIISFGSTLGISALLFNHVLKFPGADPSVVLFGFVFLVALGIDYNIFLMTRVREETLHHGVKKGTIKALVVTGGVITSAGVVLAATFAALGVIPILFLAQLAFVVAFGVLLDTIVVRSLLVPALTLEIGKIMWWPGLKKSKSPR
jgi:RND superfamily putative drug exporter